MTSTPGAVALATAGVARLYGINQVPAQPTYPYGTYSASLGRGDSYTADAREGVRWGRVVVQIFGKSNDSLDAKYEEIRAALVGKSLAISGYSTTPCRAELDPTPTDRDPDDSGVVGVTATFTFTATKEA